MEKNKLVAAEARMITEASSFISNVVYKNIRSEAEHGRKNFTFSYSGEDPKLLEAIKRELLQNGYDVYERSYYDEELGVDGGDIVISW